MAARIRFIPARRPGPALAGPGRSAKNMIKRIFTSSLGKKYIMAVSGFVLFLFVIGHLVGNLQIFLGAEAINRYGHFLQSNPELIWPARAFLVLMVGLHIWSAIQLSLESKAARPVPYGEYRALGSTYASRHMLMSGLIVLAFIIYHLLHFTAEVQAVNGTGQDFHHFFEATPSSAVAAAIANVPSGQTASPEGRHDIFKMMVVGFNVWWVSASYIIAMGLLCLHLSHGASSMFQSMGWKNEAYRPFLDRAAQVIAVLIFLGYISIPIAILCGYGKEVLK